eukprot:m.51032 g.51032  ORF g.51032 m.51032 type:complete len:125 (+) comp9034_c0_seq3:901-1275(+)
MATYRWNRKTHSSLDINCQKWVEHILLCSHRIARGLESHNDSPLANCLSSFEAWFRLMPPTTRIATKADAHNQALPALPWEMWYMILSFVATVDMPKSNWVLSGNEVGPKIFPYTGSYFALAGS